MTTTIPSPASGATVPGSRTDPTGSGTLGTRSGAPEPASGTHSAGLGEPASDPDLAAADSAAGIPDSGTPEAGSDHWLMRIVVPVLAVVGGAVVAGIGFVGSYNTLVGVALAWGFSPALAPWAPVAWDGAIIAFLAMDLYMIRKKTPWPAMRLTAHVLTAATIIYNAQAAGSVTEDPVRALGHGSMPFLFVMIMEAARKLVIKRTELETGYDTIPWHRWLYAPRQTWGMSKQMRMWEIRSYKQALQRQQDLTVYQVFLEHREARVKAGEEGVAPVTDLDRLPMTMAKYGLTVDQALALPQQQQADEQQRAHEAGLRTLALDTNRKIAKAQMEIETLRADGQVDVVRAEVTATAEVAKANAEAATATAEAGAHSARRTANLTATAVERIKAQEAEALEAESVAETRARTAEHNRRAAEDEQEAAEAAVKAAEIRDREAAVRAQTERTEEETERLRSKKAGYQKAIAESERATAEARRAAAEHNKRAAEAEALADLSPTQIKTRMIARYVHPFVREHREGDIDNGHIASLLGGAAPATASTYKKQALLLIGAGYDPATGYDPEIHHPTQ